MNNTAPRKHFAETIMEFSSARYVLISPDQLHAEGEMDEKPGDISKNCHIYLICKRPAIFYGEESIVYEEGILSGSLTYRKEGDQKTHPFKIPFPLVDDAVCLKVMPSRKEIQTFDKQGRSVRKLPAGLLGIGLEIQDLLDFEVLYVGQAFAKGEKTAIERLRSHSTLQKILSDSMYQYVDDEVQILTFEYQPARTVTSFDGMAAAQENLDTGTEVFFDILENPPTLHQQICLIEAGLIRYFTPHYNTIYKHSFPAVDQKILDHCYNFDFCGLAVGIEASELKIRLYSSSIKPSLHHLAQFDLHDPQKRKSFFTFNIEETILPTK